MTTSSPPALFTGEVHMECQLSVDAPAVARAALLELQVPPPLYHEHVAERSSEARGHMALPVAEVVATALMLSQ